MHNSIAVSGWHRVWELVKNEGRYGIMDFLVAVPHFTHTAVGGAPHCKQVTRSVLPMKNPRIRGGFS